MSMVALLKIGKSALMLVSNEPELPGWVQHWQLVQSAAVVARSLGCQCDTEMPTGRTLTET